MTSRPGPAPARAARPGPAPARMAPSRLPGWVTVLGAVVVLGELAGGALLLGAPGSAGGLAALTGGTRSVVLQVEGSCAGDGARYTTPAGDGHFDMPAQEGLINCFTHGGPSTPVLQKTVTVRAGGTVTISTFNGYGSYPLTCSITVDGQVLSQVQNDGIWGRATCRAKIP